MNQNLILQFLYDLEQNNCREWFHDHKQQYQAANGIFEELVETLMLELKKSDPTVLLTEPGKLTFKPVSYTHLDVYKRQGRWSTAEKLSGERYFPFENPSVLERTE